MSDGGRSSKHKQRRSGTNMSAFTKQEDVDTFNEMRRGYKSPMPGFEEDFFVNMLKA